MKLSTLILLILIGATVGLAGWVIGYYGSYLNANPKVVEIDETLNPERLAVSQVEEVSDTTSEMPESSDDSPALSIGDCEATYINNNGDEIIVPAECETDQIKAYITKVSEQYGIDPALPLKIAECEANFKNVCNYAVGCVGGIGIFQLTSETFNEALERMKEDGWNIWNIELPNTYSPYKIDQNISVALWLMNEGEYERWDATAQCDKNANPNCCEWESTYWRVKNY